MQLKSPKTLLTASGLAIALALGPVVAQQAATPDTPANTDAPVQGGDQPVVGSAQGNAPLGAPETVASQSQVMPDTFADIVERVSPAVVNITTTSVVSAPVGGIPGFPEGSPFSDLFRDFGIPGFPQGPDGRRGPSPFDNHGPMAPRRSNALGSGFVISADGYIVTNNHVIDGADEIEIEFKDGHKLPAEVVGRDDKTDIALLKVEANNMPFVKFGDSDKARVGDWVLALGNPLGQGLSASTGIVSARGRALTGTYDDFIQTDAAINRGNSGGPLFNMDGEVMGVNTAILSPNGGSIGIGFSMASNVVTNVVAQLQEFGETRRGWLGVQIQDVTPELAEAMGRSDAGGAMVTDVPEGPAADAGMQAGDVIVGFAGQEVTDTRDLVRRVAEAPVGEAVDVTVLRDGEERQLEVTLGRRELAEGTGTVSSDDASPSPHPALGMSLVPLTQELAVELGISRDTQGMVVQSVEAEGAAASAGLASGDIITEVGSRPVTSMADFEARIDEAREAGRKSVLVLVRRGGAPRFVALSISQG